MESRKEQILDRLNYVNFYSQELGNLKHTQGDNHQAVCPFHEDKDPSFSVNLKTGIYNCFGCDARGDVFSFYMKRHGCDFKSALGALGGLVGVEAMVSGPLQSGSQPARAHRQTSLTLQAFADHKRLPVDFLKEQGLRDGRDYKGNAELQFSYRTVDGSAAAVRRRVALEGKNKFFWRKNDKVMLYGLWKLSKIRERGWCILVEGESDCLTLWLHGLPALGLPGKSNWKVVKEQAEALKDLKIYLWQEPDAPELPDAIAKILPETLVIQAPDGCKDISEAHCRGEDVPALIGRLKKDAKPHKPKPPGSGDNGNDGKIGAMVTEMNRHHAGVMIGGKFQVMNFVTDPNFNRPDITLSDVQSFRNSYANKKILVQKDSGGEMVSKAKVWLESPDRQEFKGIIFLPQNDVPGYYNLWKGFAVKPQPGDWSLLRQHFFEIVCSYNQGLFDYLLAWLAQMFQEPGGDQPGIAVVMRGREGTGKGIVAAVLGLIAGAHYLHISNPTHLLGRFNFHLKDCLLCFLDEALWGGDRQAEGILKSLITEKYQLVEQKGKDPLMVRNFKRLIIASNSQWIIPAGLDARRFFFLDVSDARKGDYNYFKTLWESLETAAPAMLHDLLAYDLSRVNLRQVPDTKGLLEQKTYSMKPVEAFWFTKLRNGKLEADNFDWNETILKDALYKQYLSFCDEALNQRFKLIEAQFAKEIYRVCSKADQKRVKVGEFERRRCYVFPPLDECRKLFETALNVKTMCWEDVNEDRIVF
jgi:hypothetical protein